MRLLQSPNADMKALSIVAPIVKGGTGADNSTEAVQNLGGLNAASLGQANGVAKLNAQGKLDLTVFPNMVMVGPTLNGPTVVYTGQTVDYIITNYDIKTTYEVSASVGSLTRSGDTISYTAPGATGPLVLTVNNKVANVSIESTSPIAPSITSPVTGSTNLSASVSVSATVFAMNTGADTHLSSDWQVATDSEFTNVVSSSVNDTVNKTSWTATGLSPNTSYYVRVRYKGTVYGYGAWSNANTFSTKVSFIPTNESAILTASDKAGNNYFGFSVSVDSDGTRIVVGAYGASAGGFSIAGKAYVFSRSGSNWTEEAILSASDKAANYYFGYSVSINSDGSRIVAGSIYAKSGTISNAGKVYVFSRSGTTWTEEASMSEGANAAAYTNYGRSVMISSDGNRIIVGAASASPSGLSGAGRVYIYSRSGTTWTEETVLTASNMSASAYFGRGVAITSDGSRVAIGSYGASPSATSMAGAVYVFSRSGTTWTQEAILTASDKAANDNLGIGLSINSDGSRIITTAYNASRNSISSIGKTYVFSRSGSTWSEEAGFLSSDGVANDKFGFYTLMSSTGLFAMTSSVQAGSPGYTLSGKTYIHKRNGASWSELSIMTASDKAASDNYGRSIAISQDEKFAVIGSDGADPGGINAAGKVYIYM